MVNTMDAEGQLQRLLYNTLNVIISSTTRSDKRVETKRVYSEGTGDTLNNRLLTKFIGVCEGEGFGIQFSIQDQQYSLNDIIPLLHSNKFKTMCFMSTLPGPVQGRMIGGGMIVKPWHYTGSDEINIHIYAIVENVNYNLRTWLLLNVLIYLNEYKIEFGKISIEIKGNETHDSEQKRTAESWGLTPICHQNYSSDLCFIQRGGDIDYFLMHGRFKHVFHKVSELLSENDRNILIRDRKLTVQVPPVVAPVAPVAPEAPEAPVAPPVAPPVGVVAPADVDVELIEVLTEAALREKVQKQKEFISKEVSNMKTMITKQQELAMKELKLRYGTELVKLKRKYEKMSCELENN